MVFENEKTLSFQIQEIMRAERLVHDEQIQEEIEVYNSIMPPSGGLSATLFIEITYEKKIKSVLNDFIGLTNSDNLYFEIGDEKVFARFEEGREKEDKISSVHYVQFYFNQNQKDRLADLTWFSKDHGMFRYCSCMRWRLRSSEFQHSSRVCGCHYSWEQTESDEAKPRVKRVVTGRTIISVMQNVVGDP